MSLFTRVFWAGLGLVLLRTAIAGLVPFVPGLFATPLITLPLAASTIALTLIVTVLFSIKGSIDPASNAWWVVLLYRGIRQFAQFAAAAVPVTAVLLTDVDWNDLLLKAAASAVTTICLAALTLIPAVDTATTVIPGEVVVGYEPERIDHSLADGAEPAAPDVPADELDEAEV